MNHSLDKGGLKDLIAELYEVGGEDQTHDVADRIKDIGFQYATAPDTQLLYRISLFRRRKRRLSTCRCKKPSQFSATSAAGC